MSAPHGPIRLLLVDDHPVVRDGLRGLFADDPDFAVVGEAATGAEAVSRVERLGADVVLMDLRMPQMGGVEAIRRLRERAPSVRVLVLTTYDTDSDVLPAIEPGRPATCSRTRRGRSWSGRSGRPSRGSRCCRRRWPCGSWARCAGRHPRP